MDEYLLILRDHEQQWERFSDDELRAVIARYSEWNARLAADEQLVAAGKLASDLGQTVRSHRDEIVVDGPYAESKEAVAGYYQIRAASRDDALAAASRCPILSYGGSVEVRLMVSSMTADHSGG